MKKFKLVSNIMAIIAVSLFILGIIISAISKNSADSLFLTQVELKAAMVICLGVGAFLLFAKNDIAKKVGNGLTIVAFIEGILCTLITFNMSKDSISIGAICVLAAAILLLLHYTFLLVTYILNRNTVSIENPNEDIRIIRVKEWKHLQDEGIISEEEFEEKRIQILGIKSKTNKSN